MAMIRTTEQIGFRLKQLREKAGISQERLAEIVGVSKFQIQKYEYGKDKMNTEKLQQVAEALSVPVQELFLEGDEALPLTVDEHLLVDSYRAIPDEEIKKSILKIATNATRQKE